MKVQELREKIKDVERPKLERAFAECYKNFSKAQKEDIDQLIIDIFEGNETDGKNRKQNAVPFEVLEQQIETFLENAYQQNYFAPNRVIAKSQRPKWRFMVKDYIKQLQAITLEDPCYEQSVTLLRKLYGMLCYACNYYLFSTDDAFRSIGWQQYKLYQVLVSRTFQSGYSREKIATMIKLAVTGGLSNESLYSSQSFVLMRELKTTDVKELALEEIAKCVAEYKGKLMGLKQYDSKRYSINDAIANLCDLYLMITIALYEIERGLSFYFTNAQERDREVTLYCALRTVSIVGDEQMWLQAYEYGTVKRKIKPREKLKQQYENLLKARTESTK